MDKPEIIPFAPGQDPETRRQVLRHPDVFPLVLEVIREVIAALHSAEHMQLMNVIASDDNPITMLRAVMNLLCRLDDRDDVVKYLARAVCGQGIEQKDIVNTFLIAARQAPESSKTVEPTGAKAAAVSALMGEMLGGAKKSDGGNN